MEKHIYPIFDTILQRSHKETQLAQKGVVLWFTGLSGSGKSTLARALEIFLYQEGFFTKLLDGDNLRTGLNQNLGFSQADRHENIRRTAETAKLFLETGIVTICSFVSPTFELRELAKNIVGEADFLEIFVNCPFDECAKRDVKGIYAKALRGEIKNFTGLDAPFDEPKNPFLELKTHEQSLENCLELLKEHILPIIKLH